jgi:hypothetical protein
VVVGCFTIEVLTGSAAQVPLVKALGAVVLTEGTVLPTHRVAMHATARAIKRGESIVENVGLF